MSLRNVLVLAVALLLVFGTASSALAQPAGTGTAPAPTAGPQKIINSTMAAIGMGLSIVGIGIGIGLIGFAALSGIARQPEQAGAIQGAMYVLAGLVEGAGIIALVLCIVTIVM
jgi:F0F1-type ATP synthase membrane subunit c/vacuolar-type H+-ATPase subunit K